MTNKETIVFQIDPIQGALIRKYHREIIEGTFDQNYEAFTVIFGTEPAPHEVMIMQQFARAHAEDWGSPDLAGTEIKTTQLGVIQGGRY